MNSDRTRVIDGNTCATRRKRFANKAVFFHGGGIAILSQIFLQYARRSKITLYLSYHKNTPANQHKVIFMSMA